MSLESDDNQALKPIDLVLILAIAGRIDAEIRIFSKQLDTNRSVYYGYAVLDSLSSSSSMFKYFTDVFLSNTSNDEMHDLMMSPGGIIGISLETLFLVGFSVLAAKFDKETEDNYKKWIATAWPYFRDVMKGLKNAYKGWRSAVVAANLLGGINMNYLIAPVGLVLGVFAAANRFWFRSMFELRKVMIVANEQLRKEVKRLLSLTHDERKFYLRQIKYQTEEMRIQAFFSVGIGGFLDGLYLYFGVLSLAVLSPPLLVFMVVMCSVYTVACIITRVYEEYDNQLKLELTQTKCKIELIAKETETAYSKLLLLQKKVNKSGADIVRLKLLKAEIHALLTKFDKQRVLLSKKSTHTYFSATLQGLKHGLYAYGALASVLFLTGSILTLSGVVFPPALLIICASLGLAFIIGFIIHSLVTNYKHLHKEESEIKQPYHQLTELRDKLKLNMETNELLEKNSFRKALDDGIEVAASPQSSIPQRAEAMRSLVSGLGKGQKILGFFGNCLQIADEQGHYHDSELMQVLSLFSAVVCGTTLGLRSIARDFGRQDKNSDSEKVIPQTDTSGDCSAEMQFSALNADNDEQVTPKSPQVDKSDVFAPDIQQELDTIMGDEKDLSPLKASRESIQQFKPRNDSPPCIHPSRSIHSFFNPEKEQSFHRSKSDISLISKEFIGYTIQDLG
ncbi:hypothetical protein TUM19329_01930 [Legionella antarctica]|uniref:Transmembrane protein n=1 Tax=Legionella antarctica TaxID=2708020 RepID=A0A6F8T1E2_9GAMM|nr:hypothetical protein [Legionella antarctica]BCA93832.1 hypothetical protein TUM19329_01930 [Legionella antarctica]